MNIRLCFFISLVILLLFSKVIELGVIYRIIAITLLFFSTFYCLKVLLFETRINTFLSCLVLFCIIYIIYTFFSQPVPNERISRWGMLLWMLPVQLSIFPIYYFTKVGIINEIIFIRIFKVLFVAAFLCYIGNYYKQMNNPLLIHSDGFTNNMGYYVMLLLPYTFFLKNRISILYTVVIFILVILGMKRGAIIILLFSYFINQYLNNREKFKRIIVSIITSIAFLSVLFSIIYKYVLSGNAFFEKRVEQTLNMNTSGRDKFAELFFTEIQKWDDISLLFGKGVNYSFKVLDNFAHNDWFELFYTMGGLGWLIYSLYFISLFAAKNNCWEEREKNTIIVIVLIMFMQTVFSMLFFSQSFYFSSILLGYILGRQELCKKNI